MRYRSDSMEAPLSPTHTHAYTKTDSSTANMVSPLKHVQEPPAFEQESALSDEAAAKRLADTSAVPNSSCGRRLGRWYMGAKGTSGKRYCGARLSRGPFICLHVFGGLVLLLLIAIPIFTAVIVPKMIQSKFDEAIRLNPFGKVAPDGASTPPPSSSAPSMPSSFEVLPDGSAADFRFNLTLGPLMSIGGTVELVGPTTFYIADTADKDWAAVTILQSVSFPVSSAANLSILGNFSVFDTPTQACIDAIFPTKTISLVVHTQWTISFWGFNWYRNLPLRSRYDMPLSTTLQEKFDQIVQNPFTNATSTAAPPLPAASSQKTNASVAPAGTTFEYFAKGTPANFRINTTIANLTILPGIVEVVGPTVFAVYDVKGKGWANVTFDSVSFPIHKTTRLSLYGNFTIYSLPTPSVVMAILTTNQFVMVVKTWWTIKAFGKVWFPRLQLQSQFDLNSDTGTQLWNSVRCRIYTC